MPSYFRQAKGIVNAGAGFEPMLCKDIRVLKNLILHHTWSPIVFKDGLRNKKNFLYSDYCALDVDNNGADKYSLEQAIDDFNDCAVIIALTKSHQQPKGNYGPEDRFRIVTPWTNRITSLIDYEYTMEKICRLHEHYDKACVDGARLFYPCIKIAYFSDQGFTQDFSRAIPKVSEHFDIAKTSLRKKPIPQHVKDFLDKGKVFAGGRNYAVYISALHLLEGGVQLSDLMSCIEKSPFDRQGFSDFEMRRCIDNAVARFIKKNKPAGKSKA